MTDRVKKDVLIKNQVVSQRITKKTQEHSSDNLDVEVEIEKNQQKTSCRLNCAKDMYIIMSVSFPFCYLLLQKKPHTSENIQIRYLTFIFLTNISFPLYLKRIKHSFSCYNDLLWLLLDWQRTNQSCHFFCGLPFGQLQRTNASFSEHVTKKLKLPTFSTSHKFQLREITLQI